MAMNLLYNWNLKDLSDKAMGKVYVEHAGAGGAVLGWKIAGFEVVGFSESDKRLVPLVVKNTGIEVLEEIPAGLDIIDGTLTCASGKEEKPFDTYFAFLEKACKAQPKVIMMDAFPDIAESRDKGYCRLFQKALNAANYDVQFFILDARTMNVPQSRKRAYFIARRKDCALPRLRLTFDNPEIPWGEAAMWISEIIPGAAGDDAIVIDLDNPIPFVSVGNAGKLSCDGKHFGMQGYSLACAWPLDYDWGKLKDKQKLFFLWQSAIPLMTANIAVKIREQWKIGE